MIDIEKSKATCEAATEGPWVMEPSDGFMHLHSPDMKMSMADAQYYPWAPVRYEDWEFIAHARTALPLALTEIEAKDREIERLREALGEIANATACIGSDWGDTSVNKIARIALGGKE